MKDTEWWKEYSRKLKEAGLCRGCREKVKEEATFCDACIVKVQEKNKRYRLRKTEQGLCYACGKGKLAEGRKLCEACIKKNKARQRKEDWTKANARLKEAGVCRWCRVPLDNPLNTAYCDSCKVKVANNLKRWRDRKRSERLCTRCGKNTIEGSKRTCQICLDEISKRRRQKRRNQ